jgi:two-component system cell cycle sensor histidine kinase/response regulator CckA
VNSSASSVPELHRSELNVSPLNVSGQNRSEPGCLCTDLRPAVPVPEEALSQRPSRPSQPSGRDLALAGVAHDARSLVTALRVCADLMEEPGILAPGQAQLAGQVTGLADAADHLFRRLSSLVRLAILASEANPAEVEVSDLGRAVRQLRSLLSAVAGPSIDLQVECMPCAGHLRLTEESLTRILLNLVRNAADAMPTGGRIRITAQRGAVRSFLAAPAAGGSRDGGGSSDPAEETIVLCVDDDGPGIPRELLERVFEAGFSTCRGGGNWPEVQHQGLGLSIVRQLVESAGGTIRAAHSPGRGARLQLELPLTNVTPLLLSIGAPGAESEG